MINLEICCIVGVTAQTDIFAIKDIYNFVSIIVLVNERFVVRVLLIKVVLQYTEYSLLITASYLTKPLPTMIGLPARVHRTSLPLTALWTITSIYKRPLCPTTQETEL